MERKPLRRNLRKSYADVWPLQHYWLKLNWELRKNILALKIPLSSDNKPHSACTNGQPGCQQHLTYLLNSTWHSQDARESPSPPKHTDSTRTMGDWCSSLQAEHKVSQYVTFFAYLERRLLLIPLSFLWRASLTPDFQNTFHMGNNYAYLLDWPRQ